MNILSMADGHGNFLSIPDLIKTVQLNNEDIFTKNENQNTKNILAISGDYFMNSKKKGFLTNPEMLNGDLQYEFLLKTIDSIKNVVTEKNPNFETFFVIGNHDIEGGDEWLFEKLAKAPMTTIATNLDFDNSPLAKELLGEKIIPSKIVEITDDKNKNLKNHVLFLGLTIPSMDYYIPKKLHHTKFFDNTNKNDVSLKEEELTKTLSLVKEQVDRFKAEYPRGVVVIMSHTGNKISEMMARNIQDIDLILNAHDHKEYMSSVNDTLILSHGQNHKFARGVQLRFDDNGKLRKIKQARYETEPFNKLARKDEDLQGFVNKHLKKDLIPLVYLRDNTGEPEELLFDESIRYSNNILANYITSAIKRTAQKAYPKLDAVGMPSTIFRSGLKSNPHRSTFNNIDLIKMFDGINENLSAIKIGEVRGEELKDLIIENVKGNLKSKTRNALIQWSDVQINKSLIKDIVEGRSDADFSEAVKFRNPSTKKFEPIVLDKTYTILLPDKYLAKSNLKSANLIRDRFKEINGSYDSIFRKYLKIINYDVKITDKTREKRII